MLVLAFALGAIAGAAALAAYCCLVVKTPDYELPDEVPAWHVYTREESRSE